MRPPAGIGFAAGTGVLLLLAGGHQAQAQTQAPASGATTREAAAMMHAAGPFDVTLAPMAAYNAEEGANLGRMSIDKRYHGELDATGKGEMLTAMTGVKGSAGYVAVERVTGTLQGRHGSFVLQHSGTMTRGAPDLTITVVPDSGTEELAGLAGTMTIIIADGKHSYAFDYTLAGH